MNDLSPDPARKSGLNGGSLDFPRDTALMHDPWSTLTYPEARPMAETETLRAALREAETAILDVAKLIDPTAPGDRQAAEDIEAVGYVVEKWRKVLDGKTRKEIAST
jgi:hypothetical protein